MTKTLDELIDEKVAEFQAKFEVLPAERQPSLEAIVNEVAHFVAQATYDAIKLEKKSEGGGGYGVGYNQAIAEQEAKAKEFLGKE